MSSRAVTLLILNLALFAGAVAWFSHQEAGALPSPPEDPARLPQQTESRLSRERALQRVEQGLAAPLRIRLKTEAPSLGRREAIRWVHGWEVAAELGSPSSVRGWSGALRLTPRKPERGAWVTGATIVVPVRVGHDGSLVVTRPSGTVAAAAWLADRRLRRRLFWASQLTQSSALEAADKALSAPLRKDVERVIAAGSFSRRRIHWPKTTVDLHLARVPSDVGLEGVLRVSVEGGGAVDVPVRADVYRQVWVRVAKKEVLAKDWIAGRPARALMGQARRAAPARQAR